MIQSYCPVGTDYLLKKTAPLARERQSAISVAEMFFPLLLMVIGSLWLG